MSLRIVFMGAPAFAVPSLKILLENGYKVAGVVSAADKLGGRGGKHLLTSAVARFSRSRQLPLLQPSRLKDPAFLAALREWNADLQVVVAFRMLPREVWTMPPLGAFNLHGSLLPKYRGAAPINWAIINGERETGVTTFFLKQEIDTGDIIFQEKMSIGENETAGELHDRMMILGARTVLRTVRAIETGEYRFQPQDERLACPAPKIFHHTCQIDFDQPTQRVHDFIRGLSPYPGAWTRFQDKELKILRAVKAPPADPAPPGHIRVENNKTLKIATRDGYIEVLELQLEGKKRLQAVDFINGLRLGPNGEPRVTR